MKTKKQTKKGAMLVLVALVIVVLLICAVFSIDVAYMHMVRAELRTASDAAARAGAEALTRTQDPQAAIDAAIRTGALDQVSGEGLQIRQNEVQLGGVRINGTGKFEFIPNQTPFSAVRVIGNRTDGSLSGKVPLFFGSLFGRDSFGPTQTATAAASVLDVALVLDRSGSMRANVGGGVSRMDALKSAVGVFLTEIRQSHPNTAISVTSYASDATRDLQLTSDFNAVSNQVNSMTPRGLTNIFQGIQFGSDSLENDPTRRPFAEKAMIVMTDGNFNRGGNPTPMATRAAGLEQTIHTITFSNGANQSIMREVADIGNGVHIHADGFQGLAEAFREIANQLSVTLIE